MGHLHPVRLHHRVRRRDDDTLNRTDLRRRNLVSPLPSLSYGLQLAASSLLVMTAVWLWTICLGFTVFHEATSMISGPGSR